MSATNAPFGFVAARHASGEARMSRYPIASGYATAMYKGQPVALSSGNIVAGAAASDIIGILAGVEYVTSATGLPVLEKFWAGGANTKEAWAWVYDDPETEFLVQADGSIPAGSIGKQADVSNVTANASGLSNATLSATLVAAASQGQFRIVSYDLSVDNAPGDAYTKVLVKIARHQYRAAKAAF